MIPGQEEDANDRSESFAKTIEEKTGIPVNPQNIVSAGDTVRSGKITKEFSYVTAKNISEESITGI